MNFFTKKEKIAILVVVFMVIISLGFKFFIKDILKSEDQILEFDNLEEVLAEDDGNILEDENEEDMEIMVHISGEVYKPGIIKLETGKRLVDAIELAGGLKKDADLDRMNLAKKLLDEEKIYIPKIGEEIDPNMDMVSMESATVQSSGSGKININTCTKEELITLPGIGEVIAGRIVDYRSANQFKNIDDIKSVSGIGDKKFEGIKELITVK